MKSVTEKQWKMLPVNFTKSVLIIKLFSLQSWQKLVYEIYLFF